MATYTESEGPRSFITVEHANGGSRVIFTAKVIVQLESNLTVRAPGGSRANFIERA